MAKLQYGVVKAAAEASGYSRVYISRVVNKHVPWRKCNRVLLNALYQHGWVPNEGAEFLRQWLEIMSVPTATTTLPAQEVPVVNNTQPIEVSA